MKVKLLKSITGVVGSFKPGDVCEVSDDMGKAWITSKVAEEIITKVKKKVVTPKKPKGKK